MSATLDRSVAERYSKGKDPSQPSLVLEMEMGMVNRGAFLGWLSQYPGEHEILLPPLTGLEVLGYAEGADRTLVYTMQLNINMQSMTIEQVLAQRQKQCLELADVVGRDLASHVRAGDIPRRQAELARRLSAIEAEPDVNVFNGNAKFVEVTEALLELLPRAGDELEVFQLHRQPVFALAAATAEQHTPPSAGRGGGGGALVVSGSWDGAIALTGEAASSSSSTSTTTTTTTTTTTSVSARREVGSPVLSLEPLACCGLVAVGLQDRTVSLVPPSASWRSGGGGGGLEAKLDGHPGPVTALAWLPERGWLACGSEGVVVWQLLAAGGRLQAQPEVRYRVGEADGVVRGMCWVGAGSPSGRRFRLASAPLHGQATVVWELGQRESDARPAVTLRERAAGAAVTAIISLGQQALVVTGTTAGSITVWDTAAVASMQQQAASNRSSHRRAVCALAACGDDAWEFASASADGTVKLWRLLPCSPLGQQRGSGAAAAAADARAFLELSLLATLEGHSAPVHGESQCRSSLAHKTCHSLC